MYMYTQIQTKVYVAISGGMTMPYGHKTFEHEFALLLE